MWFPIMMFAICGFEHAIANMAFVPLGLMVGADETVDYRKWLYQNLILVILGNIVGGGLIVGGTEYFLYDWTKVLRTVQNKQTDLLRSNGKGPEPAEPAARPSTSSQESEGGLSANSTTGSVDVERVRQVFVAFDADHDGAINEQELMCALGALDFRYPLPLLRSMVAVESREGRTDAVQADAFERLAARLSEMEGLGLRSAAACNASNHSGRVWS
jgi:hypothetical protein